MDDERSPASDLLARGDRKSFGQLAELVGPTLERFCLAHLPPDGRDAAADICQESFLRAYRGRRRFRPGGDAVAWLLGIAMNVVREWRRRRRPGSLADADVPAERTPEPEDAPPDLAAAVEALPARQREAVVCRFLRGMTVAQTARAMGCAEGTVKAHVFKGIENLRRTLRANQR